MDLKHDEPNLMQHYQGRGLDNKSELYRMVGVLRRAYLRYVKTNRGDPPRFSPRDVENATSEMEALKKTLDRTIFSFGSALANFFLGEAYKKRAYLVVDGIFHGDRKVEGVIGIDMTDCQHEFFQGPPHGKTIDDVITQGKVEGFVERERNRLRSEGFKAFEITASKLFFFTDRDLRADGYLWTGDGANITALLPLVTDCYRPLEGGYGYVNANTVRQPTIEKYLRHSPRFVSYRLKTSTSEKLTRRLVQDDSIKLDDLIKDIAAHRVVLTNKNEVYWAVEVLGGEPVIGKPRTITIGKFQVRILDVDDHYKKENSMYKGVNLLVEVSESGSKRLRSLTIREIQLVERSKHFKHEVNVEDKAHNRRHRRKKTSSQNTTDPFYRDYRTLLEGVCGVDYIVVPI